MPKKITRQIALENVIAFLRDNQQYGDDWSEEIEVLDNMLAQIYKQAARPKSKSTARIQRMSLSPVSLSKYLQRKVVRCLLKK